jgi:hypothetical protein
VIVRPMIGSWEVPCIEHIGTLESRRLARLPVPGLDGDLQHDLGADSLRVEICGTLAGDDARDAFLKGLREQLHAGKPVTFVADILTATTLDKVLVESLEVTERNDPAASFGYRVVLREYVEPPEPPGALGDAGAGLEGELDDAAKLGLAGLDLPGLLGSIPDIGDPRPPLESALDGVKAALGGLTAPLASLTGVLEGTS